MKPTVDSPEAGKTDPQPATEGVIGDDLAFLCIEDCEADFLLVERELRRSGLSCRCRWVDNREAMLAALESERWDIVLSDYAVPGIYFPENLAYLQRRWPALPVILVSGTIGEAKGSVMLRLGAGAFVSKGCLSDLVPAIRRQLGLPGEAA